MIENIENKVDLVVETNRKQINHRATWMGLFYDEMIKAGIDAEPIMRRAITRRGEMDGKRIKAACKNPNDAREFRDAFLDKIGRETFNMDGIEATEETLNASFHYCALLDAWQKLGFDDATCELLCDMAMDGDRAIAKEMGMELDLPGTLANGCKTCELRFHK